MKKKLLAISMAAALGMGAGAASAFEVTPNGIGHYNVLPYFSVQGSNISLIHITNTDELNGKAVKVRFRSAEWSDDVLDFQLFLSPGDVWTGYVGQEGGNTVLRTADNTCSLPANLDGQVAPTFRLVSPNGSTPVEDPARTREGYIEVITMADIPYNTYEDALPAKSSSTAAQLTADFVGAPGDNGHNSRLAQAIKHVNGTADCGAAVSSLQALYRDEDVGALAAGNQGLTNPTASIASFVTVLNVEDVKAFTVAGTAIESVTDDPFVMYFRQANAAVAQAPETVTADAIFRDQGAAAAERGLELPLYQFDLPDLTTPVTGALAGAPETQRDAIAGVLAGILGGSAIVEYVTDDNVLASTEVVLNQPVRRFFYEYDVAGAAPAQAGAFQISSRSYANAADVPARGFNISTTVAPYGAALTGRTNSIAVAEARFYDREEGTHSESTDIVISPTPPSQALAFSIAGEVSVVSINGGTFDPETGTGSLGARLTAQNYDTTLANPDGWGRLSTTATAAGGAALPVIGFNAINLFNASVSGGSNYSLTLPLRGN